VFEVFEGRELDDDVRDSDKTWYETRIKCSRSFFLHDADYTV